MRYDQTQMASPKAAKERELELAIARLKRYVEGRRKLEEPDQIDRLIDEGLMGLSYVLQASDIETVLEFLEAAQ